MREMSADKCLIVMTSFKISGLVRRSVGQIFRALIKCAIDDGLIDTKTAIFDYGCGRGDDIRHLIAMGYKATGWDPVHRPDTNT